jgi:branched-chain amino acid transport system substrate-binding protein
MVTLSGCTLGSISQAGDYSGKTIKLGGVLSLSGAGAGVGAHQKQGIDLAAEKVKRDGLNGAQFEVQVVDDGSAQDKATSAFTDFTVNQQILGIIGPTLAFTASSALPVAQKAKVPVIAPSEPGKGIVGDCGFEGGCGYIFRDSLPETAAIPANVKVAAEKSPRTAVIVYNQDLTPAVLEDELFKQAFADNGITIPDGGNMQLRKGETSYGDAVGAALGKKPDVLAIAVFSDQVGALIQEIRKQGFTGTILGGDSFNSYEVSKAAGDSGAGAQSGSGYFPGSDKTANKSFVDAYGAKYKDQDGKPQLPDQAAAQAYSAVLIFAEALRNASLGFGDSASDRNKVQAALARVGVDTPLGHFAFTGVHDAEQDVWVNAMDGKGGFTNLRLVRTS